MHNGSFENSCFRILVLDDEDEYLDIYKMALETVSCASPDSPSDSITGCTEKNRPFEIIYCKQSVDAVSQVKQSIENNRLFSLAFLDIRMESELDGVWAAEQIRALDKHIEIVMVTAFMDYSPQEIANRVPPVDKIIYITKPFTINQIVHFAHALARKWLNEQDFLKLKRHLEKTIQDRTMELEAKNLNLLEEIKRRGKIEAALQKAAEELEQKVRERTASIEEKNIALEVLLNKREQDKMKLGDTVVSNAKMLLLPIIEKIKESSSIIRTQALAKALQVNVDEIISPYIGKISSGHFNLTYMEIQVAQYVKAGMSNKEIAEILGVGIGTILTHRHNLRKKLRITNKKTNLRVHLLSME